MNKNILKVALSAAVVAVAGYGIYENQSKENLSDVMLENVEALADYELPEVVVECGRDQGECWMRGDLCMMGEYTGYRCVLTDNTMFYCESPCR